MIRFLLGRITLIFVVILALGLAGGLAYQVMYVIPAKKCEKAGKWWAEKWRACATPVDVKNMPRLEPAATAPEPAATPAKS